MKRTHAFVLSLVACLATTGCTVKGRTVGACHTPYRHPAVNWVYASGGQYGWRQLLILPIPIGYPAFFFGGISSFGVQDSRVLLAERAVRAGPMSGAWVRDHDPIGVELDLETGKVMRTYVTQMQFPFVRDLGEIPYDVVFDLRFDRREVFVNWQDDSGTQSAKILTLSLLVHSGVGGARAERISDTLLIYLSRFVISVNLNVLGASPDSPLSSS